MATIFHYFISFTVMKITKTDKERLKTANNQEVDEKYIEKSISLIPICVQKRHIILK